MPLQSRFFRTAPLFCVFLLSLGSLSFAQIPSVTDTTSTPVPNAGHDYIEAPNETVNPATGSLSIRVGVPMARSRGINIPFGFVYDTNGVLYLGETNGTNGIQFIDSVARLSQGGWSYGVPQLSVQDSQFSAIYSDPTDETPNGHQITSTCDAYTDYVFQSASGGRQNLGLLAWDSSNDHCNQQGGPPSGGNPIGNNQNSGYGPYPVLATTDITNFTSAYTYPVYVTDSDGTTYSFGGVQTTPGYICSTPAFCTGTTAAYNITDRNGNAVTISGQATGLGSNLPFLTYTDSIGRTALRVSGFGASQDVITVGGLSQPYKVNWGTFTPSYTINMVLLPYESFGGVTCMSSGAFPRNGGVEPPVKVVTSIVLPNQQSYTFDYSNNPYGMVDKITYPTGAYVRYVWGLNSLATLGNFPYAYSESGGSGRGICPYLYDTPAILQRFVSYDGTHEVEEQDFAYVTNRPSSTTPTWTTKTTTVTTKDLVRNTQHQTIYTYGAVNPDLQPNDGSSSEIPVENLIQSYDNNGTLLQTVAKAWANERLLTSQVALNDTNQVSETDWHYDSNEMQTEKDDYDYGASGTGVRGNLLRKTVIPSYDTTDFAASRHIVDKPNQVQVQTINPVTGAVTVAAGVTYGYDGNGNLATRSNWLDQTGSNVITNTHTYDSYGNLHTTIDPRHNTTTYSYTDSPGTSCSGAYLASIAYPTVNNVAHSVSFTYNCTTGELTTSTDENGQPTSYLYGTLVSGCNSTDYFNRLTETDFPDQGKVFNCYNDATLTTTTTELLNSAGLTKTTAVVTDAMGHPIQSQLLENATATYVDTRYDGEGHQYQQSNPTRCASTPGTMPSSCSESTWGVTTLNYDGLGRKTSQTASDGISTQTWSYSGPSTTFTDEATDSWTHTSDALGRLTSVLEPGSLPTSYGYDTLGNLTGVTQTGASGETARTRTFTYDQLSRLLTSTNPETGTITYSNYDGNGNLRTRTDARGIVTNYTYDVLNRLTSKTYSPSTGVVSTPPAYFGYDGYTDSGGSLSALGLQSLNPIGRLSFATDGFNTNMSAYSYDAMGRLVAQSRVLPDASGWLPVGAATYDLAGDMATLTYPDGRVVTQSIDAAQRVTSVTNTAWNATPTNVPYFTNTSYDPAGHLAAGTYGNGVPFGATYDTRERVKTLTYGATTAPVWSKQYGWTPNGNLEYINDQVTGSQRQFGYDNLNRLLIAQDVLPLTAVSVAGSSGGSLSTGGGNGTDGSGGTGGTTGAVPWVTNPDDSNVLPNVAEPNSGWQIANGVLAQNAALAPDQTMSAVSITAAGGSGDTYVNVPVALPAQYSGETMSGSVWLRSIGATQTVNLYIVDTPTAGGYSLPAWTQVQLTTSWQQFHLAGQVDSGVTSLKFQVGGGGSVTSGQGFFMWNPMLEDQGIAGTSVTNFATYSQRFSGTTWNNTQGTATDNTVVAPDGSNTGSTLTANNGATDNAVIDAIANVAPFAGAAVTGSVWLKVPTGTQQVLVTLFEGTPSSANPLGAQMVTLTTAWQRFQVTGTTAAALNSLVFQIGGGGSFTSAQLINVWGAQVELASSAGPYVATGSVPATLGTNLSNLFTYSQLPTGPTWGASGVNILDYAVAAPDGSMTGTEITGTSSDSSVGATAPNAALYDGATVTASIYLRSPTGSGTINIYPYSINTTGAIYFTPQTVSLTSVWQRATVTATLPNGITVLALQIGGGGSFTNGQVIDVWGAQMQIGSQAGPYVATSALQVIAASTLTNLLPYAQQLSAPNWYGLQANMVKNSDVAPDQSPTATTVTAINGSTDAYIGAVIGNPSLYDQQTVTASVYLRSPAGPQTMNFYITQSGNLGFSPTINRPVNLTPQWQRFAITGTLQQGLTSLAVQIGGGGSFTGGESFEVWGPQLTVGTSAGAEVQGTGGSVTYIAAGSQQPEAVTLAPYGLNEQYAYDSFGNILQNGTFQTSYTANNQMFGYAYDPAGNLQSDGYNAIVWDAENRIHSVGGATYVYDAEGDRIEKQGVGVTDTISFGGRPIARLSAGQWTDLIYGPNGLIAEVPGTQTGVPAYRAVDHLGTEVGTLTPNGLVDPMDYKPFGQVLSGQSNDPYKFTGKERDQESGLDYFGARYYASSMGRFMSPDWAAKAEPVPYAKLDNPQSLNLYSYVLNNPLSKTDPDGHCIEDFCIVEGAAVIAFAESPAGQRVEEEAEEVAERFAGPIEAGLSRASSWAGAQLARAGNALEAKAQEYAGLAKNTQRILQGKATDANYRVPDLLVKVGDKIKAIGEVKDTAKLGSSKQLTDLMGAAKDAGAKFSLYLGEKTQLTKPLATQLYNSGAAVYRSVGGKFVDITKTLKPAQ